MSKQNDNTAAVTAAIIIAILLLITWLNRAIKLHTLPAFAMPDDPTLSKITGGGFDPSDFSGLQAPNLGGINSGDLPPGGSFSGITGGEPAPPGTPGYSSIGPPPAAPVFSIASPKPAGTFSIQAVTPQTQAEGFKLAGGPGAAQSVAYPLLSTIGNGLVVVLGDFELTDSFGDPEVDIFANAAPGSGSTMLRITPSGGFTGSITLSYVSLDGNSTLNFETNPVNIPDANPVDVVVDGNILSANPNPSFYTITGTSGAIVNSVPGNISSPT